MILKSDEEDLLRKVLWKHRANLMVLVDALGSIPLSNEQREELREAIADELLETGLDKNDEPNEKGLLLEKLIDRLGHL